MFNLRLSGCKTVLYLEQFKILNYWDSGNTLNKLEY